MEDLIVALLALGGVVALVWWLPALIERHRVGPRPRPARSTAPLGTAARPHVAATDEWDEPDEPAPLPPVHTYTLYDASGRLAEYDLNDYASCGELLGLQLLSGAYAAAAPGSLVAWRLADGLTMILVYDLGGSEQNVPADVAARWAVSRADLFERALRQSAARAAADDVHAFELRDDAGRLLATLTSTPSCFMAALALLALRDAEVPQLFALPNWCNALSRDVDDGLTSDVVRRLAGTTSQLFADAERPGVPDLFWRDGDRFARVEHDGDDIVGPPELVARLG